MIAEDETEKHRRARELQTNRAMSRICDYNMLSLDAREARTIIVVISVS